MTAYIVGYDVADRRRLQKIHKFMTSIGMPIQKSVFLVDCSEMRIKVCLREVSRLLNLRADDCRCYRLPVRGLRLHLGRAALPKGIVMGGPALSIPEEESSR